MTQTFIVNPIGTTDRRVFHCISNVVASVVTHARGTLEVGRRSTPGVETAFIILTGIIFTLWETVAKKSIFGEILRPNKVIQEQNQEPGDVPHRK